MDAERQRILNEAARLSREIDQYFLDAEHWNTSIRKADEDPIDPDPDGGLMATKQNMDRMLKREAELGHFPCP